ncbi:hypothetical protein LCGC14_2767500 [marine sediment metagenome]|uniref:Uncharacterized protein n=1 Tax=marine sediment metagenome TaxID=412755 RepID=A0A0F8ZJ04_9ZZZZ
MLGILGIAVGFLMVFMAGVASRRNQTFWMWAFITFAILDFFTGIAYFIE